MSSSYSLEFASLEDACITTRYFPRVFKKEEAERLRIFVREVKQIVGKTFGEGS